MCCVLVALIFAAPRLSLFFMLLFTPYVGIAFHNTFILWPVLGWFFMPYTTLAYAVAMNNGGLQGLWMAFFILGVLMDFGAFGWMSQNRRRVMRRTDVGDAAHEIDHGG